MKYKIIFISLDNTLLDNDQHISTYNKKIITKLKKHNVDIVLTSSKHLNEVIEFAKQLNIKPYVISSNGAVVYDYIEDNIIYENTMDNKTVKSILEYATKNDLKIYIDTENKRYCNQITEDNKTLSLIKDKELKIHQITVLSKNYNRMISLPELFNTKHFDIYNNDSSINLRERKPLQNHTYRHNYINVGVSKGKGINELLEHLKLDKEDAVGIGYTYNDLSMFESVDLSIAMDNATSLLKESANITTKSNNEDGVGFILNKIFELGE